MSNGPQQQQQQLDPEQGYQIKERPTQVNYGWSIAGDCPALRDHLAAKEGPGWALCRLCVAYFRGFAQTAFANNPISGAMCATALAILGPGTFVACGLAGLLGLVVSILIKEPAVTLENGLTVFNPLIFGAVSYYFVPIIYGEFDGVVLLLMFFGVVFATYMWRALAHGGMPCLTLPFNLAELMFLFTLQSLRAQEPGTLLASDNATESSFVPPAGEEDLDWGMVVRATVASASQLYVIDSVPMGAVVYLAVLIYSPTTCFFGYLGSFLGTLVGLHVGTPKELVYAGLWGFNGYLTGACLGGSFLVLNTQSAAATTVAVVFTGYLQHMLQCLMKPYGLPVGTLPFVITGWLFLGLGKASEGAFFYPATVSSPEAQRQEHLTLRRAAKIEQMYEMQDPEAVDALLRNGKPTLT